MAEQQIKKVTRKVIKRAVSRLNPKVEQVTGESVDSQKSEVRTRKICYFCESKTIPSYTDLNALRKFLTERGKIVPKLRSAACSKHQRRVTIQIKYARHLGLLPFTPRV